MPVVAETTVPLELVALVGVAIGSLVYAIRMLVSRRPSPEEQVRIAILEVVRTIDRRVRQVLGEMKELPVAIRETIKAEIHQAMVELENRLLRREHPKDAK